MENSYKKLALAISINAVIMFFMTYVTLRSLEHFQANINRAYMALIMAAPMIIVMLLVNRAMFMNQQRNTFLIIAAVIVIILLFVGMRTQTPVGDVQFLRSMIPHHSSAILMCEEASLTDPEIIDLCDQIIQSQQEEIQQMQSILERYR